MSSQSQSANVIGIHYRVGKKIGEGSFGIIFEGVNLLNNQQVAIKFEPRRTEAPQLRDEYRAYRILAGSSGIPRAYYFGQEGLHNILVIDLLGPSLEDLFEWCGRRFSPKTVAQVAKQMISRVQTIHDKDLIFRDIKPDNFLIGKSGSTNANTIHIVDFGMAKYYRDPKSKQHIPYRERKSLSGTARYMSINTHLGREQSRRDDLESLGHVFLYFLRGSLPWQGLKAPTNKQKYEKIGEKKRSTPVADLVYGLPSQFGDYLTYVRNLAFEQHPDYDYLRSLMDNALQSIDEISDGYYDWMSLNGGKGWDAEINKKPNLHGYGNPNPRQQQQQQQQSNAQQQQRDQQQQAGALQGGQQQQIQQAHLKQKVHSLNNSRSRTPKLNQNNYLLNSSQYAVNSNHQNNNNNNKTTDPNQNLINDQTDLRSNSSEKGFWSKVCCCN
ncbi:Casein kinase I [Wickerhamomyces ciferrii]|uniref:non-specific serine/threonine protein kinase n=1 Tax=Wickerhamomyces ciferrii (strain ATCC 14091 / BCRC 22168 / CBS 111 / JCM 3599 / NBRC 0793 / NRRL Y-1031 F-60-10) TaxID=1206466 RepID=K0KHH3_WICCF|nr:Casein kinase I [Wickerhamomyces ciferrii]CCH40794.1 Casein kinase I [Wickerhamomyces ciferrii]